ncbi:MAG TPA: adenosine kinase [Caulobacteraceae bacterium]|jgi:sugar/nucleoside kinase (ribokinase family)
MPAQFDVAAIGNAIVDVLASADDAFLGAEDLAKGSMMLIDEARAHQLYVRMAAGVEASGGSAANTVAGVASLGGRAHFAGKVATDALGEIFAHDIRAIGVDYATPPLADGPATARCLINVTPDGERTMCTFLGAAVRLTPADIDPEAIAGSEILYLEGYLFDPEEARAAFGKAAHVARAAGRSIALSLSDAFVVERHRPALLDFIDAEVDILFANEAEITALFETNDLDEALARVRGRMRIAAVTRGANGAVVLADGEAVTVPAEPVAKVVDTTGAGDQYAAGFLVGLAGGRSLEVCSRLGAIAAAEVISHFGPRPLVSLKDLAVARGL